MPVTINPQTFTASGTFSFVPQYGDAHVFLGISGSPGGFTIQLQGASTTSGTTPGGASNPPVPQVAGAIYDIGLFNSDFAGPFQGPISVPSFPVGYYGVIRNLGLLIVTWTMTSGSVVIEAETGFFQASSPTQVVGAVGLSGTMPNLMLNDQNIIATEPALMAFNKIPYQLNLATRPSPLDLVPHNT